MDDPRPFVLIALLLVVVLVARRWFVVGGLAAPALCNRWTLAGSAALFSMAMTVWVWGGIKAPAVVDDEAAYVLQADLFAHLHWSRPSPVPFASFTQPAVLVTPVLAPKMAPGHAILLAPGVAIGLPGLMPVLMTGVTAMLLILLVSEFASPGVAVLTLVFWLTAAGQMRWRASYFSEITTGMLWLLGWWALVRWRRTHHAGWLFVVAAVCGWGAITRPLTMLVFALPVGVVVIRDVVRGRYWRQLVGAIAVGVACLTLLPLQNHEVLGSWRRSPLALYTEQYMPFDVIGFGLRTTPPTLGLPATLQPTQQPFIARHREHLLRALPGIFWARLHMLRFSVFGGWRVLWLPAAIIGLIVAGVAGWFALGSALLLYVGYLLYAHEPHWTIYYLEAMPVFAFVCAAGLAWLLRRATAVSGALPLATAIATGVVVVGVAFQDLDTARVFRASAQRPFRALDDAARATGTTPALVFLQYSAGHDPDANLLRNVADPDAAFLIIAYDRGPDENARAAAALPNRRRLYWDGTTSRAAAPLPAPPP